MYPNRIITMAMGVLVDGDSAEFILLRRAESDHASCTDAYKMSIE